MKTFGVEEYISTKYFTPFDHKNMSNDPANPKMGCTIVTQLANSRPGQNKKHSQDGCSTGNGSVQSVQSYSAGSDTDYKNHDNSTNYLTDLTENHYIRGVSPAPLPPVRLGQKHCLCGNSEISFQVHQDVRLKICSGHKSVNRLGGIS